MRPGALNELLAALSRRAGLAREVHPHMLRHGFGSNVLDSGGALDEAQALLGHASPASTQVYLHPDYGRLRSAVDRIAARSMAGRPAVSASPAVLPQTRPQDDGAEDLWDYLEPAFLDEAGWDPETRTLAPSPGHLLLGYRLCLVRGCAGQGRVPDGFCDTCRKARRQSDLSDEEFIAAGPAPAGTPARSSVRQEAAHARFASSGCSCAIRTSTAAGPSGCRWTSSCATRERSRCPASARARSRSAPGRHTPGGGSAALTTSAGGNSTVPALPRPKISPPGASQAPRSPAATRS